jgi:MFS family permease
VCKLGLVAVSGVWGLVAMVVLADRAGKGIRTGPRDAMISLATPRSELGTAFGVHRSMDTFGAMLGPLLAFALLAAVPLAFDVVFVVSFCFALVGLAVLVLFVQQPRTLPAPAAEPVSLRQAVALLSAPRVRALGVAAGLLGVVTISDAFVYMVLQRRLGFDVSLFPLLFVGTALVYMLAAAPVGRLADRAGRSRIFLGGYALLLGVYCVLLAPTLGFVGVLAGMALLGLHYAATDGVLMALGSATVPEELRATGLAALATVTSLARLLSSVAMGAAWVAFGMESAVAAFAVALALAVAAAALVLRRAGA